MKNKALFVLVSVSLLCIAGCGGSDKPIPIAKPASIPPSGVMTLSQEQLLTLDWHSPHRRGARVMAKRAVGAGVEFVISFPTNDAGNTSLDFVSSGEGGKSILAGGDSSGFRAFALKITLVSVNGLSESEMKQKLVVGAVIGPTGSGVLYTYTPTTLSMADSEKTAIAQTPTRTDNIRTIGFHIHVPNPEDWDPLESKVALRIEPAPGGGIAPWFPPGSHK